ncbi:MAG: hypothetical protein OXK81_07920 [Chloroflexota bacterium]|nr:hypothetical protein [Chloroflexota bacterium]MDE2930476.1 hypothetical protein [Chloroflexota bacterium]
MTCNYLSAMRQPVHRVGLIFILALLAALWPQPLHATDHTIYFPETGASVSFGFKRFFEERGGVEIFGYPITPEIQEGGRTVQYFQRARFEYHPEHAGTRYEVQLGLLGDILTSGRTFPKATPVGTTENQRYFPETGHIVSGAFLRFFNTRGKLDIFGYPTSEVIQENGKTVQYFQRSRFEYYPQLPETHQITLGLLGEELAQQAGPRGQFWVTGMPATLKTSQIVNLQVAVQNTGILRWSPLGPSAVSVGYRWLDQASNTVLEGSRIALPNLVSTGSVATVEVSLTTPAQGGAYTLQWDFWQQGRGWVAVRDPSAATRQAFSVHSPLPTPTPVPTPRPTPVVASAADGMLIRVGVFSTTEPSVRISGSGRFHVEDENGRTVRSFTADQIVTVTHIPARLRYRLTLNSRDVAEVSTFARFVADDNTILSVLDLPNFQQYRNVVEVRYSAHSQRLWAINELPMEYYVKGIGEEPEDFPFEGLKAATVAYRTYALSHMDPQWPGLGCICGKEPFDITAGTEKEYKPYDGSHQLYLGYYRETFGSNLEAAANATRGQVLTYDGKLIRAAYYATADGRTRSWSNFPWAVSVPDPVSEGMTLDGHGWGMPMRSVITLANRGMTYDQILKMYYTGVELTKLY